MDAIRDRRLEESEPYEKRGLAPQVENGDTCRLCHWRVPKAKFGKGRYCLKCDQEHEARIKAHTERIQRDMPKHEILVVLPTKHTKQYKNKLRKLRKLKT